MREITREQPILAYEHMEMSYVFDVMGTTGSVIMCASSIPQILKTYRMKCADGLSGSYLAVLMIGMTLILLYALHIGDIVFIMGNGVSLTLTAILIGLRCQYKRNSKDQDKLLEDDKIEWGRH